MNINIIVAVAQNRAIGYRNQLLYSYHEDLQRFKSLTIGHTIIMGRKTYQSLPNGALPNRRNIVVTRQSIQRPNCDIAHSIQEALELCNNEDEVFIIGGAEIYRQTLPIANRLYLTLIKDTPNKADTYFPDYSQWKIVHQEEHDFFYFEELIPPKSMTSTSSPSSSDISGASRGNSTIGS
jgi:dihydrofolate reductase